MNVSSKMKRTVLGEIAEISSGGTPSRKVASYWNGEIPWVKTTQIQNCVITKEDVDEWITEEGLKRSSAKLVPEGTILLGMIGQGKTRGQVALLSFRGCTNQNAATIQPYDNCNNRYLYQYLLFNYQNIRDLSNSSGQGNLNIGLVRSIRINLPQLVEQKAIASLLFAIEKTERLIEAKEKQLKYLVSTLLIKAKHPRAHVRDITSEVSIRNKDEKCQRVLSVTNHSGFILPEEQFERRVASNNLSNYKIVLKHQYAYNPSRINVGSIARLNEWNEGVLSPMYVVFKLNDKKINNDYFLHWLSSHEAKERIKRSAQGSVRETVSFTDFGAISFPLPKLEQQQEIAETLNIAQKEIELLKKLVNTYKKQKHGLMQKLLTGHVRVTV